MGDLQLPDKFEGPGLKIERAKHHLQTISGLIVEYEALDPFPISYELNPDRTLYECRFTERLPPFSEFGIMIGEFVYQLRSALDHVIYELSLPNFPNTVPERKKAERVPQFPLSLDDPTEGGRIPFQSRHLKYVAAPVIKLVSAFQPYSYGDNYVNPHPLAVLEALNVRDKHRIVHPAATDKRVRVADLPEGVHWKMTSSVNHSEIIVYVPAHLDPAKDLPPDMVAYNLALHVPDVAAVDISFLHRIYDFVTDEVVPSFNDLVT